MVLELENLEKTISAILEADPGCIKNDQMLHIAVWAEQNNSLTDEGRLSIDFIRDYTGGFYVSTEVINKVKKRLVSKGRLKENSHFHGHTYDKNRDHVRLTKKIKELYDLMKDGTWRTVAEIHEILGHKHSTIDANLRNLRREDKGYHQTPGRKRNGIGDFEYKLIPNE